MITWKPNRRAKLIAREAIFEATKEVFELDIKPEAVKLSPVTPAGMEWNISKGKKGVAIGGTGHNRNSIDVDVVPSREGARARLFTQSGYGGYLEKGTRFMRAQPYLRPAFDLFIKNIIPAAKKRMHG